VVMEMQTVAISSLLINCKCYVFIFSSLLDHLQQLILTPHPCFGDNHTQ
jgi:hypothetical protein